MKKLILLCFIFAAGGVAASAQNGPNGNPGPSTNQGWQQGAVLNWQVAQRVLREARQWAQQNFGLSLGQMIQQYAAGNLTVELLKTSPPSWTFRVS